MAIRKINTNGKDTFEVYINLRGPNGRLQKRLRGFSSMRAASEAEFKLKAEFLDKKKCSKSLALAGMGRSLLGERKASPEALYDPKL